jgi:hypothetical protein
MYATENDALKRDSPLRPVNGHYEKLCEQKLHYVSNNEQQQWQQQQL